MAASLIVMVARASPAWPDGAAVAHNASALRDRLLILGADDVQAFAEVLASPRDSDSFAAALVHAAEVPLEIAERAADVAELASRAASEGKAPLRPDAEVAAILAEAATRCASLLVQANVDALPSDHRGSHLLEAALLAQRRAKG